MRKRQSVRSNAGGEVLRAMVHGGRRVLLIIVLALTGCTSKGTKEQAAAIYTCPMHHDVIQSAPGKCPVCGMDLVLKDMDHGMMKQTTEIVMLSESQIRLANITTEKAAVRAIGQTLVLNARLAVDEDRTEMINSRAAGRVEKLYIKETGRPVRVGDPMLELYSENLLTLQREFLLAVEQALQMGNADARYESFAKSARKKLLRYGLTAEQVDQLAQSKEVQNRITFLAPAGGIVTSIVVEEGQYVDEGAALYQVEDISRLWVEAELYPGETKLIKPGDRVQVKIGGFENAPIDATVTFVSPEYRNNSQVTLIRAALANPQLTIKPGMQAQVSFTHSSREVLAIPMDAVIREEKGMYVFVETEKNTFERRAVTTGLEDVAFVEITSGLKEGDVVAVTGAYLLYSELKLKGGMEEGDGHVH